jgi:hypothetical protein
VSFDLVSPEGGGEKKKFVVVTKDRVSGWITVDQVGGATPLVRVGAAPCEVGGAAA